VDGRVVPSDVVRTRTTSLGILIFKKLTVRRLYKSFGVKGLMKKIKTATRNNILHC
jgi:hypothetical protein